LPSAWRRSSSINSEERSSLIFFVLVFVIAFLLSWSLFHRASLTTFALKQRKFKLRYLHNLYDRTGFGGALLMFYNFAANLTGLPYWPQ
jgi:hypothetical protein